MRKTLAFLLFLAAPLAAQTPVPAYREDSAHASGDFGALLLVVRNDAGTALCGTTGDYCALSIDASGNLRVTGSTTVVGTVAVTQSGSWTVTANQGGSWSVSLAAGSNTIGKVDQGAPGASAWLVDGSGVVQPVSVASLPLPLGAATSAKQDTGNTSLASIDGKVILPAALDGSGYLKTHEQGTAAISAAALPLPSNASQETGGNLAAIAASASVMDDWDETDRAKVNLIAGQAGVQGASGAVSANTQRVVLATDVALPAGNNNIGDVDVATLPAITGTVTANAGTNLNTSLLALDTSVDGLEGGVGAAADAAATAGGTGSITAKLRFVTTALDDIRTSVQAMDDWDESDRAKVNIIAGQAGVDGNSGNKSAGTLRVVIATDQPNLTTPLNVTSSTTAASNSDGSCVSVAATTTVLSSFSTRHGATIFAKCTPDECNTDTVFIKFAATATTSDYPLGPGDRYSLSGVNVYTGVVDAIANSGTQKVCVLEW